MVFLIANRNEAAIIPPINGEIIHELTMAPMVPQSTILNPAAAIPPPITPPTMEWVVDTGAPANVARFNHNAAASNAAIMAQIKLSVSVPNWLISMMPPLMVDTTSPPAIKAPAASKIIAIMMAPPMVNALEPTAGPTLLATSLAPIFIAI